MSIKSPILIVSRWPSVPGGAGGTETVSGYKRAESEDGEIAARRLSQEVLDLGGTA